MKLTSPGVNALSNAARVSGISLVPVVRHLLGLYFQMKKQEKICKEQIPVIIANITPSEQFSFSSKDIQRITKYYQLALNLICDNQYQLTGNQLTPTEHKSILLLSIFLPLFDDLFDEQLLEYSNIEALISEPGNYEPSNITDKIVRQLYLQLLGLIPQQDRFVQNLKEVGYWEQQSLKQFDRHIGEEELTQITYNKSYYSILLFSAVLSHDPEKEIEQLLYPVAGLMQLTNDVFDVWKDTRHGVYTIPNHYRNYHKLEKLFLKEIASINRQVSQLPYSNENKRNFLIRTHALHAMGWISLQQLKLVTADKALTELTRKELVCDMDNLKQQIKWVKLVRQFSNYYDHSMNNKLLLQAGMKKEVHF